MTPPAVKAKTDPGPNWGAQPCDDQTCAVLFWVSGTAWMVSWFCLGLEIFHWHHVTKTLRLNPPKVLPGYPKRQPGLFLLSVLAGSAVAPVAFVVAVIMAGRQPRRRCRT